MILKLSQYCFFETDEFWCIVGVTAILRLLPKKNSTPLFFNQQFAVLGQVTNKSVAYKRK